MVIEIHDEGKISGLILALGHCEGEYWLLGQRGERGGWAEWWETTAQPFLLFG